MFEKTAEISFEYVALKTAAEPREQGNVCDTSSTLAIGGRLTLRKEYALDDE